MQGLCAPIGATLNLVGDVTRGVSIGSISRTTSIQLREGSVKRVRDVLFFVPVVLVLIVAIPLTLFSRRRLS